MLTLDILPEVQPGPLHIVHLLSWTATGPSRAGGVSFSNPHRKKTSNRDSTKMMSTTFCDHRRANLPHHLNSENSTQAPLGDGQRLRTSTPAALSARTLLQFGAL